VTVYNTRTTCINETQQNMPTLQVSNTSQLICKLKMGTRYILSPTFIISLLGIIEKGLQ